LTETNKVLRCKECRREYPHGTPVCPQHGDTLEAVDPLLGRTISGKYRLQRCVGRGGMGAVYESRHIYTEQRVAVKILAAHLSRDLKLVARFRREAMATSRLRHENCVGVHDFGEDEGGIFFIAMEFVDGHGIGDELRAVGPMPVGRVVRIAVQLLSALEAAHGAGILHRDLKPQNIMLTQKVGRPDFVKVVDFGIAKFIDNSPADQAALTLPGTIFGTPEYMSPEQARGEVLDARSDLYSSAVVIWHMLLGRSPFRGKTVRETLMNVFRDDPPSPRAERPDDDIPEELEKALRRALEKEAADRYQTAEEFKAALAPYAERLLLLSSGGGPLPGLAPDGSAPETVGMEQHAQGRSGTQISHRAVDVTEEVHRPEPFAEKTVEAPQPSSVGETQTATPAAGGSGTAAMSALPAETEEQPRAAIDPDAPTQVPERDGSRAPASARQPTSDGPAIRVVKPDMRGRKGLGLAAWVAIFVIGGAGLGVGLAVVAVELRKSAAIGAGRSDPRVEPPPPPPPPSVDPLALQALLDTAQRALARDDDRVAIRALNQALALSPENIDAHKTLGMLSWRTKDYPTARKHLAEAARLDPRYAKQFAPILMLLDKKLAAADG